MAPTNNDRPFLAANVQRTTVLKARVGIGECRYETAEHAEHFLIAIHGFFRKAGATIKIHAGTRYVAPCVRCQYPTE